MGLHNALWCGVELFCVVWCFQLCEVKWCGVVTYDVVSCCVVCDVCGVVLFYAVRCYMMLVLFCVM